MSACHERRRRSANLAKTDAHSPSILHPLCVLQRILAEGKAEPTLGRGNNSFELVSDGGGR